MDAYYNLQTFILQLHTSHPYYKTSKLVLSNSLNSIGILTSKLNGSFFLTTPYVFLSACLNRCVFFNDVPMGPLRPSHFCLWDEMVEWKKSINSCISHVIGSADRTPVSPTHSQGQQLLESLLWSSVLHRNLPLSTLYQC